MGVRNKYLMKLLHHTVKRKLGQLLFNSIDHHYEMISNNFGQENLLQQGLKS
jgi:hypothetical protein